MKKPRFPKTAGKKEPSLRAQGLGATHAAIAAAAKRLADTHPQFKYAGGKKRKGTS